MQFCYCMLQEADQTLLSVLLKSQTWKSQITKSSFSQPCTTNKLHMLRGRYTFQISVGLMLGLRHMGHQCRSTLWVPMTHSPSLFADSGQQTDWPCVIGTDVHRISCEKALHCSASACLCDGHRVS